MTDADVDSQNQESGEEVVAGAESKSVVKSGEPALAGETCSLAQMARSGQRLEGYQAIRAAAEMIEKANFVVALTGSGLSVDSGVPDFRGKGGLWSWYEPSVYASLESFLDDPSRFWEMVQDILPVFAAAQPNPAHLALAEMEKMGRIQLFLSQNIDELLERTGCNKVVKIHGNLLNTTCIDCGTRFRTVEVAKSIRGVGAPTCPDCHGRLKPDVILFGEPLSARDYKNAKESALKCDVMLVIGSSLGVYPMAQIPVIAKKNGSDVVLFDVNPKTGLEVATVVCRGKASDTIPALLEECKVQMGMARCGE